MHSHNGDLADSLKHFLLKKISDYVIGSGGSVHVQDIYNMKQPENITEFPGDVSILPKILVNNDYVPKYCVRLNMNHNGQAVIVTAMDEDNHTHIAPLVYMDVENLSFVADILGL